MKNNNSNQNEKYEKYKKKHEQIYRQDKEINEKIRRDRWTNNNSKSDDTMFPVTSPSLLIYKPQLFSSFKSILYRITGVLIVLFSLLFYYFFFCDFDPYYFFFLTDGRIFGPESHFLKSLYINRNYFVIKSYYILDILKDYYFFIPLFYYIFFYFVSLFFFIIIIFSMIHIVYGAYIFLYNEYKHFCFYTKSFDNLLKSIEIELTRRFSFVPFDTSHIISSLKNEKYRPYLLMLYNLLIISFFNIINIINGIVLILFFYTFNFFLYDITIDAIYMFHSFYNYLYSYNEVFFSWSLIFLKCFGDSAYYDFYNGIIFFLLFCAYDLFLDIISLIPDCFYIYYDDCVNYSLPTYSISSIFCLLYLESGGEYMERFYYVSTFFIQILLFFHDTSLFFYDIFFVYIDMLVKLVDFESYFIQEKYFYTMKRIEYNNETYYAGNYLHEEAWSVFLFMVNLIITISLNWVIIILLIERSIFIFNMIKKIYKK